MSQEIEKYSNGQTEIMPITPGKNLQEMIAAATIEAKVLDKVIRERKLVRQIGQSEHLYFEAWQIIGTRYGATVKTEKTEPIMENGKVAGWKASVAVLRNGLVIGGADHICMLDEPQSGQKTQFSCMSKAQTRAASKALRFVFAWVAELAGFAPTPAEEMEVMDKKTGEVVERKTRGPEEKIDPSTHCTFGKRKGERWDQMDQKSLDWFYGYFTNCLEDKSKEKYHPDYIRAMDGIESSGYVKPSDSFPEGEVA